jgi:hypothetical protein
VSRVSRLRQQFVRVCAEVIKDRLTRRFFLKRFVRINAATSGLGGGQACQRPDFLGCGAAQSAIAGLPAFE